MSRNVPVESDIPPRLRYPRHEQEPFKQLRSLTEYMHSASEAELDPMHHWRYCRLPVEEFNAHMRSIISPGWDIMADESIAPYLADDGQKHNDLPMQSFVPHKPKPIGAEIKNTADALSKVMLYLELCEGIRRLSTSSSLQTSSPTPWP
eukprot:88755-Pleurochrysis_carterae.AAC.2